MEFFVDTGVVDDVKDLVPWGLVDGVTTNPSLIAKSGRKREDVILEMCEIQDGPVSAEVITTEFASMVSEGKELASLHPQIVIKLPLIEDGLKACAKFSEEEIKTNVTLCFSSPQALLAAKCGATYISPFLGRLDDIGHDGMALINEIRTIYDNFGFTTQILAASLRHSAHVREAALLGADVATCPPKVIKALLNHPLTDRGLEQFLSDHAKANQ